MDPPRDADGVAFGVVRCFPYWLLERAREGRVSSRAIFLWSEIASLVKHGSRHVCDASATYLAERLPARDGKRITERTVYRLIEELVAVRALSVFRAPGRPAEYVPHLEPLPVNLNLFESDASNPRAKAADRKANRKRPSTGHPEAGDPTGAAAEDASNLRASEVAAGGEAVTVVSHRNVTRSRERLTALSQGRDITSRELNPEPLASHPVAGLSTGTNREGKQRSEGGEAGTSSSSDISSTKIEDDYRLACRRRGQIPRITPADCRAAGVAAGKGTADRWPPGEARVLEFLRTMDGLTLVRREASLSAVLNHLGETWGARELSGVPTFDGAAYRREMGALQ